MILTQKNIPQFKNKFLEHFQSLSKDELYNRFFHTMSIEAIDSWLDTLFISNNPILFFIEENAVGDFIGILQVSINNNCGDISISVTEKRKGIASKLMSYAIAFSFEVNCLVYETELNNSVCRSLFSKFGFISSYDVNKECIVGTLMI